MTIEKIIDVSKNIIKEHLDSQAKEYSVTWVNNSGIETATYPIITEHKRVDKDIVNCIQLEYSNFIITILPEDKIVAARPSDFWKTGFIALDLYALADLCNVVTKALKSEE